MHFLLWTECKKITKLKKFEKKTKVCSNFMLIFMCIWCTKIFEFYNARKSLSIGPYSLFFGQKLISELYFSSICKCQIAFKQKFWCIFWGNHYCANQSTGWLQYDFGEITKITSFAFQHLNNNWSTYSPKRFTLQGGVDNENGVGILWSDILVDQTATFGIFILCRGYNTKLKKLCTYFFFNSLKILAFGIYDDKALQIALLWSDFMWNICVTYSFIRNHLVCCLMSILVVYERIWLVRSDSYIAHIHSFQLFWIKFLLTWEQILVLT